MFIKTVAGPATVIAAALGAASGAIAQDSAVPVGPGSAATPASPAPTTNPAPGRSAPPPAQPGTTSIPPSDPAIAPQNGASDPGKAGERIGPPSDNVPPAGNPHDPADVQPDAKAGPSAGGDEGAAGPTTSSASPARPATSGSQVSAFVDAQFPTVDSDGDGALTPAEFEGWITKLKAAELEAAGQPADPQEVKSYARNALMNADKDGDQRITRAEATQFFSG